MRISDQDEFRAFAEERLPELRRTAHWICGDWHHAEDIAQIALTKIYATWDRRHRIDNLEAFAQTVVTRASIDHCRRRWRRERPVETLPDSAGPHTDPSLGLQVRTALNALPTRQRAVVVLRFWADLDIATTAKALNCSAGTVKSHTARALAKLRELLGDADPFEQLTGAPGPAPATRAQ
ncbi:SigE family RNA polymerase sigma factor [Kitasatospora sp. NPDC002551]|uniref:SigE family RNA polymerase sigma factor n=1 Tax=unclassified Kitasatospora TaxID=2633591 RepID=UPI0033247790